jgi:hypothetical protein
MAGALSEPMKPGPFPLFYESGIHQIFLEALQEMGWSWRNKAQGGVSRPAIGERQSGAAMEARRE